MVKGSIIKCFNCGCKVEENSTECPKCNAKFEDTVYTNLPDDICANYMKERNIIGNMIISMSYIILIPGIIGSYLISMSIDSEFSVAYAIASCISCFILFALLRGVGEVIQLLHDIRRKEYEK